MFILISLEIRNYISSTEIFEVGVSSGWKEVAPLPHALSDPRAVTLNNNIYLFGKSSLLTFIVY